MRTIQLGIALSIFVASTSVALPPPGAAKPGLREGANHHTGDDSFVEAFGREPRRSDDEKLRMRVHFKHVRAWLASRPPTRPDLKVKREKLLGYLDEYIAKGTTPKNVDLAWRTPVFIDHENTICAVGYLIERSAGRALPEKIAAAHRFSYIEDIARVMPEVSRWVEESGMTLEEIASIQPGYSGPEIDQYIRWTMKQRANGPYGETESGREVTGAFRKHQMTGPWTKTEGDLVRGSGTFVNGSGTWRSNFKTGARMAEGKYANSQPTGTWRFYHPSGNLAAEGQLEGADRRGAWRFYYDSPAKTLFAKGNYSNTTAWQYFDEDGALVATTRSAEPKQWRDAWGSLVSVEPGGDQVRYQEHRGGDAFDPTDGKPHAQWRSTLESFALGTERVVAYKHSTMDEPEQTATYDAGGHKLVKVDGVWQASDCKWSAARKQAARSMDVVRLHGLLAGSEPDQCGTPVAVTSERGQQIDTALATRRTSRAPIPKFVTAIRDYENTAPDPSDEPAQSTDAGTETDTDKTSPISDLVSFATDGNDHFDTRFIQVFRTIAGTHHRYE